MTSDPLMLEDTSGLLSHAGRCEDVDFNQQVAMETEIRHD